MAIASKKFPVTLTYTAYGLKPPFHLEPNLVPDEFSPYTIACALFPRESLMRIATDVDMVLVDFDETWRRAGEVVLRRPLQRLSREYALAPRYGLTPEETARVWEHFTRENLWRRCHPIPHALRALRRQQKEGHTLFAVSAIPESVVPARRAQLDDWGLTQVEILATGSPVVGGPSSKEAILRALHLDFYADDRWDHCAEAQRAGVPYIAHIASTHDSDGHHPIPGIPQHDHLGCALHHWRQELQDAHERHTLDTEEGLLWIPAL